MAFYDASAAASGSGSGSAAGPTTYTPQHTTSLPHLAPQGNSGPSNDTQSQAQAQVSLDFTDAQVEEFREQDRFLPIANVARIMKNALPGSAKVSKEAKECVQECVSEFISFITSEAADKCANEKRKTIGGEDILTSMQALGFDNYAGVMKVYLSKFRVHQANLAKKDGEEGEDDDDEPQQTGPGRRKKRKDGRKRKRESEGDVE